MGKAGAREGSQGKLRAAAVGNSREIEMEAPHALPACSGRHLQPLHSLWMFFECRVGVTIAGSKCTCTLHLTCIWLLFLLYPP